MAKLLLALGVLGAGSLARADLGEADISFPYAPLGSLGTPVSGVSGVAHGLGNVTLHGWTFPMGDQQFSQFMVSADGFLTPGTGQVTCGCTSAKGVDTGCANCDGAQASLPSGSVEKCTRFTCTDYFTPQFGPGLIAPYFSTVLSTGSAIGTVSSLEGGSAGAHYLIVDYNGTGSQQSEQNATCNCSIKVQWPYHFQAILFESGSVVFDYGTASPTVTAQGEQYSDPAEFLSLAYFPPPSGNMTVWSDGGTLLGPSVLYSGLNSCMSNWLSFNEVCSGSQVGQLTAAYMGDLNSPFLSSAPAPSAVAGPSGPTLNLSVTVTNNGKHAQAGGYPVDFFLIKQGLPPYQLPSTCDAGSGCLASLSFANTIASGAQAAATVTNVALPSPLPPMGYYAVASSIDPTNATLGAAAPLLGIGSSSTLLPFGQDMTGSIGVTTFTPGDPTEFTVPLQFVNQGLEDCNSVDYQLDFVGIDGPTSAATGTVKSIAALSSVAVDQLVPIPTSLPAGVYQLRLKILGGSPADLNTSNNTVVGVQHVENGQDVTASINAVPFSIPSPTTFDVPVTFHNLGLQTALSVSWTMALTSADGITSVQVGAGTVPSLAGLTDLPQTESANIVRALPGGSYTLSLSIVGADPSTPDLDTANNFVVDSTPIFIYSAAADYGISATDLQMNASTHVADGQVVGITRTIHNLEGPASPCPYSYFLTPLQDLQIGDGVPVAILGPAGSSYVGTTPSFAAYGQPGDQNTASDQIVIPPGMPVGNYELVLALDPGNQVTDINPGNNNAGIAINVAGNPLQITSASSLPAGIVNTPYIYQLTESGAGAQSSWSLLAGNLPPGVELSAAGLLTGTPVEAGVFNLVVQLAAGGGTQVAVLQLPVATGSGALEVEISSSALPTAIAESTYIQQFVAQGGVPPYSWSGALPQGIGLTLSRLGLLAGIPPQPTNGPVQITVTVTDAIGTQASRSLTLLVIGPGSLAISTPDLQHAVVGTGYDQPILCSDEAYPTATFTWKLLPESVLPNGILFQPIGSPSIGDLTGTPTQAGIFPIIVNVTDNFGHTSTRQFILTVLESPVPVSPQTLPIAILGATYAAQLTTNTNVEVTWRVFSGVLPDGLTLDATGAISGTVANDATTGGYPFAAAVTDNAGDQSVVPLEIQVQPESSGGGGGCASGSGPIGVGFFLMALAWLARRQGLPRSTKAK